MSARHTMRIEAMRLIAELADGTSRTHRPLSETMPSPAASERLTVASGALRAIILRTVDEHAFAFTDTERRRDLACNLHAAITRAAAATVADKGEVT